MTDYNPAVATAYLQVRLDRRMGTYASRDSEARIARMTMTKPDRPLAGCVVVKVKVRLPVEAWDPFEPEATINIPAGLIQSPVVEVEAEDPEDGSPDMEEDR